MRTTPLIEDESAHCFETLLVGDCDIAIVRPRPAVPRPTTCASSSARC